MVSETAITKSLLELVFSFMPGSIYWVDQDGVILGANDQEAKTLGFKTRQEAIGKKIKDICPSEIAENILKKNLLVLEKNIPMTFEEPWIAADGTEKFYLSHKIPFWVESQLIGVLGISTDITDQKMREKLEAEQETLKKANDMMRFWAGAIAHEIRTPLMSIALMADTLDFFMENLTKEYPELFSQSPRMSKSLEYIQKMPKNFAEIVKSMNHFVDMALMKVSPEKAKVYELKPMQIKESVKMVLDAYPFKPLDEDKNERELVHVNIVDNFTFNGDETLFRHLIYNLVKNAIFFIKKAGKGEIFIDAIAGKATGNHDKPLNYLIIKDTGPGIAPENIQHLFKAFFTRTQNGTGVGLSLCKSIMNEFGGSIHCESVEGEFTKFVMGFPG
jgi:PAS domain S-box-containing protein